MTASQATGTDRWTAPRLDLLGGWILLVALGVGGVPEPSQGGDEVTLNARPAPDYLTQIKPLLTERCVSCHGALQAKAGLRLDAAPLIRRGGDAGPIVELGHADESLLIDRVTSTDSDRMPPEGQPLSPDQIDTLKRWIDAGAIMPETEAIPPPPSRHWSFLPPRKVDLPQLDPADKAAHPIDALLEVKRRAEGVSAVGLADRRTLIRRVTLDLTGLAPTPEEVAAFLNDPNDDETAWNHLVDRLLASPRFGERWARHWMDVWRYSDWAGYGMEIRESRPHLWRWRDWIVESLNADRPYSAMIEAMIAGDEVRPHDPDTLRATGYLARNWHRFNRNVQLESTVEHLGKGFLGLTLNCAKCHDHKYDPITQDDFYRMRAFFEPIDVRTDRVPGQANLDKDGVTRVFDAFADRPTHLLVNGDEAQPDTSRPLTPGTPRFLDQTAGSTEHAITPLTLPLWAVAPDLRPFVLVETFGPARTARRAAWNDFLQADAEVRRWTQARGVAPQDPAILKARIAREASRRRAIQTRWEELALAARAVWTGLEATRDPSAPRTVDPAPLVGLIQRWAAWTSAEARLATLEAEHAAQPIDPANPAQAQTTRANRLKQLDEARTQRDKARADRFDWSQKPTPLGDLHPPTSTGRRLALARWIASPTNPLTARVAVNHVWMRHFGAPLVGSVENFGLRGQSPTHPEVLDWLAVEFMESGWSFKHLHRLILTSRAYRLRSDTRDASTQTIQRDPDNHWYWRARVKRMEAELVRDNLWYLSGGLDPTMGGPELPHDQGETVGRRSLYFQRAPEKSMRFLDLFDAPGHAECYRRFTTVMPQQALALVNSAMALHRAEALADLLSQLHLPTTAESDAAFLRDAFERVLNRPPTPAELDACLEFLDAARAQPDQHRLNRIAAVHVLFNHHDFVTIR